MNDTFALYETGITKSAEANCYAIFNLCRVGIAASASAVNVDLANKGGYDARLKQSQSWRQTQSSGCGASQQSK